MASSSQQIVSIGTATVTVPFGSGGNGLTGQIAPYTDPSTGVTIPGLVVYGDHFQLGTGTIRYNGTVSFGSCGFVQSIRYISVSDLSATYGGSFDFNGSITIGAGQGDAWTQRVPVHRQQCGGDVDRWQHRQLGFHLHCRFAGCDAWDRCR